jgi:hypothetical protein
MSILPSCNQDKQWKGQEAIQKVSTLTVPVQKQVLATFDLGNDIYCSNDFAGARLNGIVRNNDSLITALITPENTPINDSPWYSFKLWSAAPQTIYLKLTYLDGVRHRYYPKWSRNGHDWEKLDSSLYSESASPGPENERNLPDNITVKLSVGPDTLWISAQELMASPQVNQWIDRLDSLPFVSTSSIGKSLENKPIRLMKIGKSDDQKLVMVISRQHPPEVTGYLAMAAFVETICADTELAKKFRSQFNTYVIPLANPDGVDHGHWRHSAAGIDLNRDWSDFHQPETAAIRGFMKNKVVTTGGKFYFGVDFHSTWEDIFYTIDPSLEGNMPGLVPRMIEATGKELANYQPNIRPRTEDAMSITSMDYFFREFGAESLTYEIGDNTPRDLLKKKGEVSATKLMELLLE